MGLHWMDNEDHEQEQVDRWDVLTALIALGSILVLALLIGVGVMTVVGMVRGMI